MLAQGLDLLAQGFDLLAQGFDLLAQGFDLLAQGFDLLAQGFDCSVVLGLLPGLAAQGFWEQPTTSPRDKIEAAVRVAKYFTFIAFISSINRTEIGGVA